MVETQGLGRTFTGRRGTEVRALADVGIAVPEGAVLGLLGPNGAGKTTLSRILTTLLLPTTGTAQVAGFDVVRSPRDVRRAIGLVLGGDRGLYRRLSARQNLLYWAALRGLGGPAARRRVDELIERLGLTARAGETVGTFSRGMTQRVHLARALLTAPRVLIMDEPTSGMDPNAAAGFRTLVRELIADGVTILLATHDMAEAQALCSRLALIDRGRILRTGGVDELLAELPQERTVTASGVPDALLPELEAAAGTAGQATDGELVLRVDGGERLAAVLAVLAGAGIAELTVAAPTLTEVYRTVIADREFAV